MEVTTEDILEVADLLKSMGIDERAERFYQLADVWVEIEHLVQLNGGIN